MEAWQKTIHALLKERNGYVRVSHVTDESIAFEANEFLIPQDLRLTKFCLSHDILQWIGLNKNKRVSWVFAKSTEA